MEKEKEEEEEIRGWEEERKRDNAKRGAEM